MNRRDFFKTVAVGSAALGASAQSAEPAAPARSAAPAADVGRASHASGRRPNILLILSDQERAGVDLPAGLGLDAHDWIAARGTSYSNFNANTTPCSPSRANLYTGQHTQLNGVTTNVGAPPFPELKPEVPTLGHMLRAQGYRTAYKGKWHLSDLPGNDAVRYGHKPSARDALEPFGFADYSDVPIADGGTWAGFRHDAQVAAEACQWLRDHGRATRQPWFLAVNFVNPHDIVFYDDPDHAQSRSRLDRDFLSPLSPPPIAELYDRQWDLPLPKSWYLDTLAGKPWAQTSYVDFCNACYGRIDAQDEARWRRYQSYYFNCIRDVDRHALRVLRMLEALKLDGDTIVVYTADHGEMAGAHRLRQKGPHMYKENVRVPLLIRHPDVAGGVRSDALGSAIDLTPTLLAFAGLDDAARSERYPTLKGVNLAATVAAADARTARDRKGHLYDYNTTLYIDPDSAKAMMRDREAVTWWTLLEEGLKHGHLGPVLTHPGLFRGVHDGRYKFARYFAPAQHHIPRDWNTLLRYNQLELYDTQTDPDEIINLAAQPEAHKELILSLNDKINTLIMDEIGFDDGREHPGPTFRYQL